MTETKIKLVNYYSLLCNSHYYIDRNFWKAKKNKYTIELFPHDYCKYINGFMRRTLTGRSSDSYLSKFDYMRDYVESFPYVSERSINELISIMKETKSTYFHFSFVEYSEEMNTMTTIRMKNKIDKIKVLIKISDVCDTLKTKTVKLTY